MRPRLEAEIFVEASIVVRAQALEARLVDPLPDRAVLVLAASVLVEAGAGRVLEPEVSKGLDHLVAVERRDLGAVDSAPLDPGALELGGQERVVQV